MTLKHLVNKSPEFVYDYLTDMQKFVSVHPVIYKIDKKTSGNYLVYETLKLGFVPVSFTYPAMVTGFPDTKKVVMSAVVMKLTNIEMTFEMKESNGLTQIDEVIVFKSPLPIRSIMENIFKNQHSQLFKNIELLKH